MPRNPNRRACAVPGCHAWARHDGELCASHAGSRALRNHGHLAIPLLKAVAAPLPAPTDDLAVIEAELRRLEEARARFLEWIEEMRADAAEAATAEDRPEHAPSMPRGLARGPGEGVRRRVSVTPVQFLRAWGDSSARVVALLRARHELTGGGAAGDDALDALYRAIEGRLTDGNGEAPNGH